jgi:uncharacterized protein YjdB
MKKISILSLLLCCLSLGAFSQTTTTIWSTGATGSFTSGNSTATTRTDNNIVTTAATQRGYTVFDLTSIPAGSGINSVIIGFYVTTYGGLGAPSGWNTYGYAGDLSTLTTAATLFPAMTSGSLLTSLTYGTGTGNQTLASTAGMTGFIQANAGNKVSISWTGGGTRTYTIKGENGVTTAVTAANHAPYLIVNYCPPPVSVTATASPGTLCDGGNLTLNGAGAGTGLMSWSWTGPDGFTSFSMSPTLTTSTLSAGVYTLTATNTCGVGTGVATAVTPAVVVNALPTAFTGGTGVCTGSTITLASTPTGGSWTSSDGLIASINAATGVVTGVAPGTVTITYTDLNGCVLASPFDDNSVPDPIAGPSAVCLADVISLTDGIGGGTWSSDFPGIASVGLLSGVVSGNTPGTATISYATAGCPPVTYAMTVNNLPAPIFGPSSICVGSLATLTDADPGGSWASSDITLATVGLTGDLFGVAPGSLNITYTDAVTTCHSTFPVVVNDVPVPMGGPSGVCQGSLITLTDATPGGTYSGGGAFATVVPFSGDVTGVTLGVTDITYTITSTTCQTIKSITVNPLPSAIAGTATVCAGATRLLTDPIAGGSWTSMNIGIATVDPVTGVVTGVAGGIALIDYTLLTTCATSISVTVNAAPVSVISPVGPTTFCAGSNVILNASTAPGITYQWNVGGVPVTGATTLAYTALSTGNYTVSETNIIGCTTVSAPVHVTAGITALLSHATPLTFCVGNGVILKANNNAPGGIIVYQWLKNGVVVSGGTDSLYNATTSGNYSVVVRITGSGTCVVNSDTNIVTVNPLPVPVINFTGSVLTTTGSYTGYQWYLNNVSIAGASSSILSPTANGSYKVRVADGSGCAGFSAAFSLTNVGVGNLSNQPIITISPNPATSWLHIECAQQMRAVISGTEGKALLDNANAKDINIAMLPHGLYLISLYDNEGNKVKVDKFIKE